MLQSSLVIAKLKLLEDVAKAGAVTYKLGVGRSGSHLVCDRLDHLGVGDRRFNVSPLYSSHPSTFGFVAGSIG